MTFEVVGGPDSRGMVEGPLRKRDVPASLDILVRHSRTYVDD